MASSQLVFSHISSTSDSCCSSKDFSACKVRLEWMSSGALRKECRRYFRLRERLNPTQSVRNVIIECEHSAALYTCKRYARAGMVGSVWMRRNLTLNSFSNKPYFIGSSGGHVVVVRNVKSSARLGGDGDIDLSQEVIADDFYSVLGLTPDATAEEIKKAYYSCMKACHPDLSGNNTEVNNFCVFINEVYEVLSDEEQRLIYDEINGFAITAINPFKNNAPHLRDHCFVDEFSCIGCKNCANTAPKTFDIESDFGRARVLSQNGNPALVQQAIDTCPVDCIHWVTAAQLTLLEDEMRRVERVNVGLMLSGMGYQSPDVFAQASWRWEKRQARAVEQARIRMMKESGRDLSDIWWRANWGSDNKRTAEPADNGERAAKTAAAARRWREYSRRGVDRRIISILPSAAWSETDEENSDEKAVSK